MPLTGDVHTPDFGRWLRITISPQAKKLFYGSPPFPLNDGSNLFSLTPLLWAGCQASSEIRLLINRLSVVGAGLKCCNLLLLRANSLNSSPMPFAAKKNSVPSKSG